MKNNGQRIFAVSGVKNSGKTTLITLLLPFLTAEGLRVATIKHDGHDFNADIPGTDTFRHFQAGAYGTAIFSDFKFMVVKRQPCLTEHQPAEWFPEADLILLEGFKTCPYPKIELIRKNNSEKSVCEGYHLTAIATDLEPSALKRRYPDIPILDLNNPREIAAFILEYVKTRQDDAATASEKRRL